MTIDVKTSSAGWSRIAQPFYKLAANDWRALKRVLYKNAAGWQEVWPQVIIYTHTGDGYNMNMHACFGYSSTPANYIFINNGVIGSNSPTTPALVTGNFPAGSKLTFINNGYVTGKGGDSACFLDGSGTVFHSTPGSGALMLTSYLTLINNGYINGGGGGGGASGDFAGSTRHNACGGGGAGQVRGISNPRGFGGYATPHGTLTAGGTTPGYGNGGDPGQNGTYATTVVNNDRSKMLFGAAGGVSIYFTDYILVGSTLGNVNGRTVAGLSNAPYIQQVGFAGDGNYGTVLYIDLQVAGAGAVTGASIIAGGSGVTLAKVSATRFSLVSTLQQSSSSQNTWRTATVRFTVSGSYGSHHFDLALKVGDKARLYEGGRSCFVAGSMVLMADGTEKPIEQIVAGDMVRTAVGVSEVTGMEYPVVDLRPMFSFGGKCVTSGEHSIWGRDPQTKEEWWTTRDMLQWEYEAENGFGPSFGKKPVDLTAKMGIDWDFATVDGWTTCQWQQEYMAPETQLYHLLLAEGGSYYVDGFLVSSMADSGGVDWETHTHAP